MKCTRCKGSGVDPKGKWTEEELDKVVRGIFDSKLSRKDCFVVDSIEGIFEREEISYKRRKAILVELGAAFPTVKREVHRIHLHLKMDEKGNLAPDKPLTDEENAALASVGKRKKK